MEKGKYKYVYKSELEGLVQSEILVDRLPQISASLGGVKQAISCNLYFLPGRRSSATQVFSAASQVVVNSVPGWPL